MAKANKTKKIKRRAGSRTTEKNLAALKLQKAAKKKASLKKKLKALEKIDKAKIKLKRKIDVCPICLEKMDKKDRIETHCGHFFHQNCIQGWCVRKAKEKKPCECPVCKKKLPEIEHRAKKKLDKLKKVRKSNRHRRRMLEDPSYASIVELDRRLEESRMRRQARWNSRFPDGFNISPPLSSRLSESQR
tara:strand:- start:11793 stop:12359 length:567 start_codon:yes stop_codon:yes gene_type:complete